ncbi:MAG TPA: asparagine synthase (glutamine-hydrolyzing) [Anaerolineales bacterium]|nr:asparagine synthase (glutamine-hydrolyzing) [Anaerolineales bacterium]
MCGITGILNLNQKRPIEESQLRQMLALIRHRGPDQFGIYIDPQVGMGSARLSILDLSGGQQPISNEDESLWIVFNGEIFNYVELRPGLEKRGHQFTTNTDTEVILHLYEEHGPDCLRFLNGQFAIAIWDAHNSSLFLARDRLGIRPIFYTIADNTLLFGSEVKALLADERVGAEIDPVAMDQIFTYWSTLSPRTIFKDVYELPPAHFMLARQGHIHIERYWDLQFYPAEEQKIRPLDEYLEEFRSLLVDATQIRLRADVPVGAYLSGGLDSSTTAAIIRNYTNSPLDTFSITFEDPNYDEREFQFRMADFLGTDHHIVHASFAEIARVFPDVIWHTEAPILRTSPAPLFILSELVRQNGYKVVMTGEGADEFLAGYNIFKEARIRRFWSRQPDSQIRPLLLKRLYPYISDLSSESGAYLRAFFGSGLTKVEALDYSHSVRWNNTGRTRRFFSEEIRLAAASQAAHQPRVYYPPQFQSWDPLHQAQYLEISIFLSQYLLSSQGDRVAMAHSVEGRYPFLDYRVVEFCNHLPPELKLRGLTEKYLLKKLAQQWLPETIWQRPKRPYRAPIHRSFFHATAPEYVTEMLSPEGIAAAGLFKPAAVSQMVEKARRVDHLSETDDMALAGVLSAQLLHRQFIADYRMPPSLSDAEDVKVCIRGEVFQGAP